MKRFVIGTRYTDLVCDAELEHPDKYKVVSKKTRVTNMRSYDMTAPYVAKNDAFLWKRCTVKVQAGYNQSFLIFSFIIACYNKDLQSHVNNDNSSINLYSEVS